MNNTSNSPGKQDMNSTRTTTPTVTAAVIMIGDEILSGRTQDTNLKTIADFLGPLGIQVREARVIPDVAEKIVTTVQEMSASYDYVFTTGGIGPTHDDITADCVAKAFGVSIDVREDARAVLEDWYSKRDSDVNEARLRMARIPEGADLIDNPVSGAPGFRLENVHVMAGVPRIMKSMLHNIGPTLKGGEVVEMRTVRTPNLKEGDVANALSEIAEEMPDLSFGSYPWFLEGDRGVALVVRGADTDRLNLAADKLEALARSQGGSPERF